MDGMKKSEPSLPTPPSDGKPMNSLRLKYSDAVAILHAVDIDADTRVIVFGDPEMGCYEWGIERCSKIVQHSDVGYGNLPAALRDGLMTAWPPMDDGLTPTAARSQAKVFPICKDHQNAEWNQPAVDDEACVLCRLFYLEAQESLLEEWQQRAKRAEDAIAEIERPLDAQMERLNATVSRLNGENERLRHDLERATANHAADLTPPSERKERFTEEERKQLAHLKNAIADVKRYGESEPLTDGPEGCQTVDSAGGWLLRIADDTVNMLEGK